MISLLDVNVLVALLVPEHEHHVLAQNWFAQEAVAHGWASSVVTELGDDSRVRTVARGRMATGNNRRSTAIADGHEPRVRLVVRRGVAGHAA